MKFSARTIQILKNFSTVHQAMIFDPGNVISIASELKTILARAEIDTQIDKQFAIYDLPRFISVISMFQDPELTIMKDHMLISSGNESITYQFAEPALIKPAPKKVNMADPDVKFNLTAEQLDRVFKGMATTGANHICITGDGSNISVEAVTIQSGAKNMNTGAAYKASVGTTSEKFKFNFKVENVKMLPGDYTVSISKAGIANFKGADVEYWVAIEQNSSYN